MQRCCLVVLFLLFLGSTVVWVGCDEDRGGDAGTDSGSDTNSGSDTDSDTDTGTDSDSDADCESCHGFPPGTGRHILHVNGLSYSCHACHATSVDASDEIIAEGTHDNSSNDVDFSEGGTWNGSTCSDTGCHGPYSW